MDPLHKFIIHIAKSKYYKSRFSSENSELILRTRTGQQY